jgi:hypothetical protein
LPALVFPTGDFQPFTKILSSEVNGKFNAIKTLLNTTKLDSTNVQQYGLSLDRLNGVVVNGFIADDASGHVVALTTSANQTVYTSTNGVVTVGQLPAIAGGTGLSYVLTSVDTGKVLQVNATGSALTFDTTPPPATDKVLAFYNF